jgi:hypothetical protein
VKHDLRLTHGLEDAVKQLACAPTGEQLKATSEAR